MASHEQALSPDPVAIEEFLRLVTAFAVRILNGCAQPGVLQLMRHDPAGKAQPVPSRYLIDDVEHMIADAIGASAAGHNVYMEMRTIDPARVRGNKRGELADTVAVF